MDIVSKPGSKSVVWEYFGVKKLENGDIADDGKVICRSCRRSITAKHGNTSNLLTHLKIHHARLFTEVSAAMKSGKSREASSSTMTATQSQQPTLKEVVEITQSYEKQGKKWKELTDSVTFFFSQRFTANVYCGKARFPQAAWIF